MAHAKAMLETYPQDLGVDADLLARAIEALVECASTCTQCADACLAEDDPAAMVKCIRLNLDCADVCTATSRVLSRQTAHDADLARRLLEACTVACRSCGDECDGHREHMAHCGVCADSCRRCEQACQELLAALT